MIKIEANKNDVHWCSEGYKKDIATECIISAAVIARKLSELLELPLEMTTLFMMNEVSKVTEDDGETEE